MQELINKIGTLSTKERRALAVLLKKDGIDLFNIAPVFARDPGEPLRLSYAQERQLFLWHLDPAGAAYHIPAALRLHGVLDIDALARAFSVLVARHETLRTTFADTGEHAVQVIHAPQAVRLEPLEFPRLDDEHETGREGRLQHWLETQIRLPFDLENGPLWRVNLLRLAADEHVLLLVQHHSVSDGGSMQVMVDELVRLYAGYSQGAAPELPPLSIQYADYALWQRAWMEGGERERQLAYWTAQLGGEQPLLELPLDRARPAMQSHRGARLDRVLPAPLRDALQQLAQREGVTLFTLLLASFQVLLHRYSGQSDIRIGVPIANRNRAETERLIGFFVNTQVLKADIDGELRFDALLQQVKRNALDAQAHQDIPFEQLVEALQPARNLSHSPLFQVLYNHRREQSAAWATPLPQLRIESMTWAGQTAQFDLTLDTIETDNELLAAFTYATDLFDAATVERLAAHWLNLLQGIVADPHQRIGLLPLLDDDEQRRQLGEWNAAPTQFPDEVCAHERFAAQARLHPEAIALEYGDAQLTYGELNTRANRLAHRLIELGAGPEVRIGFAVERGFDMIVGLLAILKAGSAYVPLDPDYPSERLAYLLADSGVQLLLTQQAVLDALPAAANVRLLLLDDVASYSEESGDPVRDVRPDHLAYVIYTSGSTGNPKGALLPHRNITRLFAATHSWFGFDQRDVWTLFHSYAFDFSVWEIFGALLHGGRLVIVPRDTARSPADFYALLLRAGVTVLNQTPSAFKQLLPLACAGPETPALRYVVFGGEALDVSSLLPWFERFGDNTPRLINMYGITETTVHVTYRPLDANDARAQAGSPIGTVIPDLSWYVLDAQLNPVPRGCRGELLVGRAGLARGYHGRAALTAQRFVPDPFGDGGRLYRTGDLAHYRADGSIDYAGRIDQQVKIRGFRIELGEIDSRLQQHTAVSEALVIAVDGAHGKQLAAYIIPRDSAVLNAEAENRNQLRAELHRSLRENLPEHMVPAHWVLLAEWPLTANGKLDRRALPAPDSDAWQQRYVAPVTELEQRIAALWGEVLGAEQVGLNDNFFELGGDSIVSIQLVSRARQAGIAFTPRDLFQHQTVQALARVARPVAAPTVEQGPVSGVLPLTPIQHWFFETDIPAREHWNQSLLLIPRRALDAGSLRSALARLIEHHDALRSRFQWRDDAWHAEVQALAETDVLWHRPLNDAAELEVVADAAQRSLDLLHGPLLRAVLMDLPGGEQRLLLVIHHLVVDGVSWRILLEDLERLCSAPEKPLPPKTSACQHWAQAIQTLARGETLEGELEYWREQLRDCGAALPGQREGIGRRRDAANALTQLDRTATRLLLQQAPAAYRTQINDLLLTALARVLCRWTGQPSALIRLEGHGRDLPLVADSVDLTRSVGWFTSLYPVKLTPQAGLGDSIKTIKEQLRAVPNKGIGYGLLRYLGGEHAQQTLRALPQGAITFNYLGQFDPGFSETGALFTPATESGGATQSVDAPLGNALSIDGQVYGGELQLHWTFSRELFDEHTVQCLANEYARELQALVEHCNEAQGRGITPSDFPLAKLSQAQLDALPIDAARIEDIYPLTPMQQGLLFHDRIEPASGAYINQLRVDVDGLDVARFRSAWQAAIAAHEILRTAFVWGDLEQPVQVVHKQIDLPFVLNDWRGRDDLANALEVLAQSERERGFDTARAPLLRLILVRIDADRHHLIYTHHHLLMDGWSHSRLLGEVLQRYSGQLIPASAGRYRDYLDWLQRQDNAATESFWRAQCGGLQEPTRLAQALRGECIVAGASGYGDIYQTLDAELTRQLSEFARARRITPNTLVQAAWLLLLQRHTGQRCVAFGATVAGRPAVLPGIEEQLGLFINTLPVVAAPQPQQTVAVWLQQLQQQNLALREYEHTPLYAIQRWAGCGGEALFDTLLVFENYPVAAALQGGAPAGLRFGSPVDREQTHYPLTLLVNFGETLGLHYSFDRAAFSDDTVAYFGEYLRFLLCELTVDATRPLGVLPSLNARECQQILRDWNNTRRDYPLSPDVPALIAARAEHTPDAVALIHGERELSYRELNRRANRLAHRLIKNGVGPERLVGIAAERNTDLVVGLLAILKAGGAYVPLDPAYPAERLAYMLENSGADLLLTHSGLRDQLPLATGVHVLYLDHADSYSDNDSEPAVRTAPDQLAYVIYTSGSTGKPKGIGITHGNLAALVHWSHEQYGATDLRGVLASTSVCFDLSVWEIFVTLAGGGYIVLARNALELPDLPARDRVRLINTVPSAIEALLRDNAIADSVRIVNLAGEALKQTLVDALYQRTALERVYDLYGPSEDTTYSTGTLRESGGQPNIGRPIANTRAYILGADLQPAPPGIAGELHLAGAGISRGYLGRPALTAEKYVPNPFAEHGERLYRTGDLTRHRADGAIEYLSRIDHQVKIRGFRIEPGEIEARLLQQTTVRDAAVLAREGPGGQQLVAYIVPVDAGIAADAAALSTWCAELKQQLRQHLPDYMVPAFLLVLPQLPLTPNGKLDRKALPMPDRDAVAHAFAPPQGELESHIAAIWSEVLGVERIGRSDHFFELGGHSLLATQVASRLTQLLSKPVSLRLLFDHPVLRDLATALVPDGAASARNELSRAPLIALGKKTTAPLSLMQRRLWVAEQLSSGSAAYGMPMAVRLRGPLSVERLRRAFAQTVQRHEVLRSAYVTDDEGDPIAQIAEAVAVDLPLEDISALPEAARETQIAEAALDNTRTPIALEHAPLWRGRIIRLGADEHVLLFAMHHIISDGWSMQVLIDDIVAAYRAPENSLPPLPLQYSDFAAWQQTPEHQALLQYQTRHWREVLAGYTGELALPLDQPRGAAISLAGSAVDFELPVALCEKLRACSASAGVTLYTTLLASFQLLMHRHTRAADVVVGIDVAGRQHVDLEALIGFFVNVLPIRSRLDDSVAFADFVKTTGSTLLDALEHQDLPFDLIVDALGLARRPGLNPLVQVLFVMNNLPANGPVMEDIRVESLVVPGSYAKFDMALFIDEEAGRLRGFWQFATALFERATIERLMQAWLTLLAQLVSDPAAPLTAIGFTSSPPVAASAAPSVVAQAAPPAKASAAAKLGRFLKRGATGAQNTASPVRETTLLPGQDLPLVLEPVDTSMDIVTWVAANRVALETRLARHAGILFRGFALDGVAGFEALAEAVQPGLYGRYGDLPKKEGGNNVYHSTPYPERKMILFHNESSHQDRWPRKQMFYCEQPALEGGATPVVDCRRMYAVLPESLRETFVTKGLLYVRTFTEKLDVSWRHFFRTDSRAEVEGRCRANGIEWRWLGPEVLQTRTRCPAIIRHPVTGEFSFFNQVQLHHPYCLDPDTREDLLAMFGEEQLPRNVCYGDGTAISDAVMREIGELYERNAVRFEWRQGDVILLDNLLVAHARDPFRGPRKIVVAMGDMMERADLHTDRAVDAAREKAEQGAEESEV